MCTFQYGTQRFRNAEDLLEKVPHTALSCVKVLLPGLVGGKGGFGANLKSAGRQKSTASFDFSACRDLNGRRLRAVNDAQRIAAWKSPEEAAKRARLGAHYQEPSGDLGVSGWHLAVPNWADSFGPKTVKRLQAAANRKEQRLMQAQEAAAADAEAAKEERLRKIEEYTNSASGLVPQAVMLDAIRAGMSRREKRPRSPPLTGIAGAADAHTNQAGTVLDVFDSPAHWCRVLGAASQVSLQYLAAEATEGAVAAAASAAVASSAAGAATTGGSTAVVPAVAEVEALVPFVTVGVPGAAAGSGAWHFEVKVASGGVSQIGWMAPSALDSDDSEDDSSAVQGAAAAAAGGDGVGDVPQSWAWDGSRGVVFSAGTERNGASTWSAGDTVGCTLQWAAHGAAGEIIWSLNGVQVETAAVTLEGAEGTTPLMPALSLQQGEAVQVNVGHCGFAFQEPLGSAAVAVALGAVAASGAEQAHTAASSDRGRAAEASAVQAVGVSCTAAAGGGSEIPPPAAAAAAAGGGATSASQLQLRKMDPQQVKSACESMSLEQLKVECLLQGLKCSGTAQQRTARLLAAAAHLASGGAKPVPRKMRAVDFEALFGKE